VPRFLQGAFRVRIRSIDCRYYETPLEPPIADARNEIRGRSCLIVRLETEDGVVGFGEAASFAASGRLAAAALQQLTPLLKEHDSRHISKVYDDTYHLTQHYGRRGVVISALSAVDVALWDIMGKRAGLPLNQLFGSSRDRIRYYFNSGYYTPNATPEACLDALDASVQRAVDRYYLN
jgi:L-alanine-DL-glutamate epimerase-like enolase superfamily enzyme